MEESLSALRARMQADLEEARRLEAGLEAEERIAQRQKLAAQLARWEEWSGLEAEARSLEPFAEDRRAEFEALAAATRSLAEAVSAGRGKRDQCAELLAESRTEARLAREAVEAAIPRAALACRLADQSCALPASGSRGMGWGGMIASAVCTAAALAGGVAAHGFLALGAVLAGLAGAAISLFASLRIGQGAAARHRERALAGWKDEWIAAGNPSDGVGRPFFSGRLYESDGREVAREGCRRDALPRGRGPLRIASGRFGTGRSRMGPQERRRRHGAQGTERAWLQARGCETFAEYDRKTARAAQLRGEIGKRRSELEVLAAGGPRMPGAPRSSAS